RLQVPHLERLVVSGRNDTVGIEHRTRLHPAAVAAEDAPRGAAGLVGGHVPDAHRVVVPATDHLFSAAGKGHVVDVAIVRSQHAIVGFRGRACRPWRSRTFEDLLLYALVVDAADL